MPESDRFSLFFALTKVDEAQRKVWGRATQQVPDVVREIFDYDSSKPNFQKWSEAAKARTAALGPDGQSLGNIREMHRAIAAGKVTDLDFNDVEKAIDIETVCVDDSSWAKVLKGVLTGFSIGGKYVKRWPDPNNPSFMRYTAQPEEISYVDAPAVPTATFKMIKADGTEELRKFESSGIPATMPQQDEDETDPNVAARADENPQPDAPTPAIIPPVKTVSGEMPVVVDTPLPPNPMVNGIEPVPPASVAQAAPDVSKLVEAFAAKVDQFAALLAGQADKRGEADAATERALQALGKKVGIARRAGEPLTGLSDPAEYGDPANWSWLVATNDQARKAIASFNAGQERAKYNLQEWNILGRRIAQRAGTHTGVVHQYSPKTNTITRIEDKKMGKTLTKDALTSVVGDLRAAAQSALDNVSNPEAVMSALHQILAGLDIASDVDSLSEGSSTPSSGVSTLTANAQAVPTGSTMAMAAPPAAPTTTPGAPTTGTSTSTTSSSTAEKDMVAKLDQLTANVEQLAGVVEAMAKRQLALQQVQKANPTIGDLNAQVQQNTPQLTTLEKAILSAASHAKDGIDSASVAEVMNASGGNAQLAQDRAVEMVRKSLAARGFNSATHIRVMDPATLANIRSQSQGMVQGN